MSNKLSARAINIALFLLLLISSYRDYYAAAPLLAVCISIGSWILTRAGFQKGKIIDNICFCLALYFGTVCWRILSAAFNTYHIKQHLESQGAHSLAICIFSAFFAFLFGAILFFRSRPLNKEGQKNQIQPINTAAAISAKEYLIILISSFITITFVSKSSFLYAFNDWVDPNCFLTMGRGILSGSVPYRDLFDQKGPLLYLIHSLAVLMDNDGFGGVYVIELIAIFSFLLFSYKSIRLFAGKEAILTIPLLAAATYSCVSFKKGDSAEELCLCFLSYALYIGLKIILEDARLKPHEIVFVGIAGAAVLWIKFLMLGLFIGWGVSISILYFKKRAIPELCRIFLLIAFGVIICSLPIILYFQFNGALSDLFNVYFYDNMFSYKEASDTNVLFGTLKNLVFLTVSRSIKNLPMAVLIILGLLGLMKKSLKCLMFLSVCLLGTIFFIYFKGALDYYTFTCAAFTPFGMIIVSLLLQKNRQLSSLLLLLPILFLTLSPNLKDLGIQKNDLAQFKFRNIIVQSKSPDLLNYDFMDGGFYTTSSILPKCKYFCILNIRAEEGREAQNEYINIHEPEFIVSVHPIDLKAYSLISSASNCDNSTGDEIHYYLYKLTPSPRGKDLRHVPIAALF